MTQVFSLAAEAFLKISLCDVTTVVDVEVMESKSHVCFSDSLSTINSDSQELGVVDLTIVVEIDALKDLVKFFFRHVKLLEASPDLTNLQSTRIVCVECSKGIAQLGEIKRACIHLINKES